MSSQFATQLEELMRDAKLTDTRIAGDVRCSIATVRNWLRGKYEPSRAHEHRLNMLYGTDFKIDRSRPRNSEKKG